MFYSAFHWKRERIVILTRPNVFSSSNNECLGKSIKWLAWRDTSLDCFQTSKLHPGLYLHLCLTDLHTLVFHKFVVFWKQTFINWPVRNHLTNGFIFGLFFKFLYGKRWWMLISFSPSLCYSRSSLSLFSRLKSMRYLFMWIKSCSICLIISAIHLWIFSNLNLFLWNKEPRTAREVQDAGTTWIYVVMSSTLLSLFFVFLCNSQHSIFWWFLRTEWVCSQNQLL